MSSGPGTQGTPSSQCDTSNRSAAWAVLRRARIGRLPRLPIKGRKTPTPASHRRPPLDSIVEVVKVLVVDEPDGATGAHRLVVLPKEMPGAEEANRLKTAALDADEIEIRLRRVDLLRLSIVSGALLRLSQGQLDRLVIEAPVDLRPLLGMASPEEDDGIDQALQTGRLLITTNPE